MPEDDPQDDPLAVLATVPPEEQPPPRGPLEVGGDALLGVTGISGAIGRARTVSHAIGDMYGTLQEMGADYAKGEAARNPAGISLATRLGLREPTADEILASQPPLPSADDFRASLTQLPSAADFQSSLRTPGDNHDLLAAAWRGFGQGASQPMLEPETVQSMRDIGILGDYSKGQRTILQGFAEAFLNEIAAPAGNVAGFPTDE